MRKIVGLFAGLLFFPILATQVFSDAAPNWEVAYTSGPSSTQFWSIDRVTGNTSISGVYISSGVGTNTFAGQLSVSTATVLGKLGFSSLTTALSTATTSGNSNGITFPAYLYGANNAIEGSVLIATTPVVSQGLTVYVSTGTRQEGWVGVAASATSTGSIVNVYSYGWVLAVTTGNVIPGDILTTTATNVGALIADNGSYRSEAIVGVALSTGVYNINLTKIRLY